MATTTVVDKTLKPPVVPLVPGKPRGFSAAMTTTTNIGDISNEIMDRDSPLMQSARAKGRAFGASRGMINSSMSGGAAEKAALDFVVPMATSQATLNEDQWKTRKNIAQDRWKTTTTIAADAKNTDKTLAADAKKTDKLIKADAAELDKKIKADAKESDKKIAVENKRVAANMVDSAWKLTQNTINNLINNEKLKPAERNAAIAAANRTYGDNVATINAMWGTNIPWVQAGTTSNTGSRTSGSTTGSPNPSVAPSGSTGGSGSGSGGTVRVNGREIPAFVYNPAAPGNQQEQYQQWLRQYGLATPAPSTYDDD